MTAGLPVTKLRARHARRLLALALISVALAGCGGDEEAEAAAAPDPNPPTNPPPPPVNRSPTISGNPSASVLVGGQYSFTPTASDPDNDPLTFAITNRPAWASFSSTSGTLSGTPTGADVATYSNIVITVSDGAATASLASFNVNVVATATGSALLTWNPPTQNTDGSPLTNLSGYRIYWGTNQANLSSSVTLSNPGLTSYMVTQLTPATWYFAATALNSAGAESTQSNIGSKTVL